MSMSVDRFNKLINGPLKHPEHAFNITRLVLALAAVVQATGDAGEKALEDWCESRAKHDKEGSIAYKLKPWY